MTPIPRIMRYLAASLLLVGLAACKKEDPLAEDRTLSVTATEEMAMNNTDAISMEVRVEYSGQSTPTVDLSITGLPDGVSATFDPQEGKGSFTTRVRFVADDLPAIAVYPVTITAAVSDGLSAQTTTKLVINGEGDCNRFFIDHIHNQYPEIATYEKGTENEVWTGPEFLYEQGTQAMYMYDMKLGLAYTADFADKGKKNVTVHTECASQIIVIPEQQVTGYYYNTGGALTEEPYTISGEGSFNYTEKTFYINYKAESSTGEIAEYTVRGAMK